MTNPNTSRPSSTLPTGRVRQGATQGRRAARVPGPQWRFRAGVVHWPGPREDDLPDRAAAQPDDWGGLSVDRPGHGDGQAGSTCTPVEPPTSARSFQVAGFLLPTPAGCCLNGHEQRQGAARQPWTTGSPPSTTPTTWWRCRRSANSLTQPRPRRGAVAFTAITAPIITDAGHRIPGLRFTDPRAQALLSAICVFRLLPHGFTNRELRTLIAPLLGTTTEHITAGKMTYDLRRLRAHGLIARIPRTRRYQITDTGLTARAVSPAPTTTSCGSGSPKSPTRPARPVPAAGRRPRLPDRLRRPRPLRPPRRLTLKPFAAHLTRS